MQSSKLSTFQTIFWAVLRYWGMKGNELKPHIGIFGRRNYGKSSLVNFLTGQQIAIVSDMAGTTTDPVKKTMEIGGVGPVVWIDTAGIDDEGAVGRMRIDKSLEMLAQADLALILFTDNRFEAEEVMLVDTCRKRGIPYVLIYSQADRLKPDPALLERIEADYDTKIFVLTVKDTALREPLTARIREALPETAYVHRSLLGDVIGEGDTVSSVVVSNAQASGNSYQHQRLFVINHAEALVANLTKQRRRDFREAVKLAGAVPDVDELVRVRHNIEAAQHAAAVEKADGQRQYNGAVADDHRGERFVLRGKRRSRKDRNEQRERAEPDGEGIVPPSFPGVHRPPCVHRHDRAAADSSDAFFIVSIHSSFQILKRNIVTSPSAMT